MAIAAGRRTTSDAWIFKRWSFTGDGIQMDPLTATHDENLHKVDFALREAARLRDAFDFIEWRMSCTPYLL
jgi:hypothetical protein